MTKNADETWAILKGIFEAEKPCFKTVNGVNVLVLSNGAMLPVPPRDKPLAVALHFGDASKEVFRDFRIAHMRSRWPDKITVRDLVELEEALADAPLP